LRFFAVLAFAFAGRRDGTGNPAVSQRAIEPLVEIFSIG
jgi:hypothetical protein